MPDYVVPDEKVSTHRGGLGSMPQPFTGNAPAPRAASPDQAASLGIEKQMDVNLAGIPGNAVIMQTPNTQVLATDISPTQLGATAQPGMTHQSQAPQMQTSPPPASPSEAAELAALRRQVGQLVTALGEKDKATEQRLAEMQFSMDVARSAQPAQPQAIALPPDLKPDQSPTWEQLSYLVPVLQGNAQAQAIRATWGISQEEEAQALTTFPTLAVIPTEPARTQRILEAVRLLRQKQAPASPTPNSASTVNPPPLTRPAQPTVAHVEYSAAPTLADAPPPAQMELILAEYNAAEASLRTARTDAERKERLAALRRATDKLKAAQGITDEMERASGFRVRQ